MNKHKHLFKKIFEGDVTKDGREAMEELFGKLPPLPNGKEYKPHIQWETVFQCECGLNQTFVDNPGGEYNKSLPEEFEVNE